MILLAACSGSGRREPAVGSAALDAAALAIQRTGAFTLPVEYTRCVADADCTFVALGCCDTTAVLRTRAAEVQRALEASGRPFCSVKAACGPGPNGTWEATPGTCSTGTCVLPR